MLPVSRRNRKPANIGLDVIFAGKLSFIASRRQKSSHFQFLRPPSRILTFVKIYLFRNGIFPHGHCVNRHVCTGMFAREDENHLTSFASAVPFIQSRIFPRVTSAIAESAFVVRNA